MNKILIVNDENEVVNLYKRILVDENYLLISALSAEKALAVLDTTFDLVIIDLDSCDTEKDAICLVRQIARKFENRFPVIIMTIFLGNMVIEDLQRLGIRQIIHKPFSKEELILTVKQVLNYNA